jgi:hypothetical protein
LSKIILFLHLKLFQHKERSSVSAAAPSFCYSVRTAKVRTSQVRQSNRNKSLFFSSFGLAAASVEQVLAFASLALSSADLEEQVPSTCTLGSSLFSVSVADMIFSIFVFLLHL